MKLSEGKATTALEHVKNSACWAAVGVFALLAVGTTVLEQQALIRDWKAEEVKKALRKEETALITWEKIAPLPKEIRGRFVNGVEKMDTLVGAFLKSLDAVVSKKEKDDGFCYNTGYGIVDRCLTR